MRIIIVSLFMSALVLCSYAAGDDFKNMSSSQAKKSSNTNNPRPTVTSPSNFQAAPNAAASNISVQVLEAYNPRGGASKNRFRLGSTLIVKVDNPQALQQQETDKKKKAILYINEVPIKGLSRASIDSSSGELRFILTRDGNTKTSWDQLICRPHLHIKAAVTVGFDDDYSLPTRITGENAMTFDIINPWGFAGWVVLTTALAFLFFHLGSKTPLLRTAGMGSSYSLAYSQMAFWTYMVCSGYVLIYLITQDMPSLNSSILILMGLSAGTALGGKAIDSGRPVPQTTGNFLNDILQDVDGYTVARLQIFIWTIITGAIFISNIYNKLVMPEFGETLLTLMGISSGTYLGFKIPENKVPPAPKVTPEQPAPKSPLPGAAAPDAAGQTPPQSSTAPEDKNQSA